MVKFIFGKIYFIMIIAFIMITIITMCGETNAQPTNYPGSGTAGDPYQISTVAQFDSLRYNSDPFGAGTTYWWIISSDIDFSGETNWVPIGAGAPGDQNPWKGSIDGNGKTLSDLTIDTTVTTGVHIYIGLFANTGQGDGGQTDDGIKLIHNITIDNFHINVDGTSGTGWDLYYGIFSGLSGGSVGATDVEIDSVIITNSSLTVDCPTTAVGAGIVRIGGLSGGLYRAHHLYIDVDITVNFLSNTLGAQEGIGGICGTTGDDIKYSAFVSTMIVNAPTIPVGGIVGRPDPNSVADTLSNCYVMSDRIEGSYYVGGLVGMNQDESLFRAANCYTQIDTLHTTFESTTDLDGYNVGYSEVTGAIWTTCYADTEAVLYDFVWDGAAYTTYDRTLKGDNEAGTVGADTAKTTAEMQDSLSYFEWDFADVWDIDPATNDGYPFFLWRVIPSTITVDHPSIDGLVFFEDSVTSINWFNDIVEVTDTFLLYLSTNNGGTWSFIDTTFGGDTSYVWTVPGAIQSDECLVGVTTLDSIITDQSDTAFTILPLAQSYTDIEIVSVVPQPLVAGGDLNIFVKSTYLDTFQLFWSYDSLTWSLIEQVTVDTVNGQIHDTTNYLWNNPSVVGDFYLRALEIRNNQLFFDQDTIQYAGSRVLAGICYDINTSKNITDCGSGLPTTIIGSEGIHTLKAIWDPSCGWVSAAGWRLYRVLLRESLSTGLAIHTGTYNGCTGDQRQCSPGSSTCIFPLQDIYEIHDTILNSRVRYSDEGGTEGTTVTVNQRRYSLSFVSSTEKYYIMVEDLLNPGVEQVYVEYSGNVNIGGFDVSNLVADISEHRLASYVKPLSTWKSQSDSSYSEGLQTVYVMKNGTTAYDDSLHNKLVSRLGFDFGDYDEGYICVGDLDGRYNTVFASVISSPGYVVPVSEDVVLVQGSTTRYFMRGIYPEAILLMRSRF